MSSELTKCPFVPVKSSRLGVYVGGETIAYHRPPPMGSTTHYVNLLFSISDHMLISNDNYGSSNTVAGEAIALRVPHSFHDNDSIGTYSDSLDTESPYAATPIQTLYRYHVFFSHRAEDQPWVENVVNKIQSETFEYRCYHSDYRVQTKINMLQNTLCAAMLSERVVVVLSKSYVTNSQVHYVPYESSVGVLGGLVKLYFLETSGCTEYENQCCHFVSISLWRPFLIFKMAAITNLTFTYLRV
jgi:hypothetical protein